MGNWKEVIDRIGDMDPSETNVEQMKVLLEAMDIFIQRNAKRRELWKQWGWEDSALQIRSKAARIAIALDRDADVDPEEVLDDAVDLINFSVFFVRNVRSQS